MDTLQQIYPPQPVIPARQQQISIKKRFAKAMSASKKIAEQYSNHTITDEQFNMFMDMMNGLQETMNVITDGDVQHNMSKGSIKASNFVAAMKDESAGRPRCDQHSTESRPELPIPTHDAHALGTLAQNPLEDAGAARAKNATHDIFKGMSPTDIRD
ncbi:hypothetical protein BGX28_002158, partial [Mortierella sp. GBA30]